MLANIELRDYDYIYQDMRLTNLKRINIIYGRNGTGKSTLTKAIKKSNDTYDVRIFNGFENIVAENKGLNSIVLGEKNVQIQNKIECIEEKLKTSKNSKKIIESEWLKKNNNKKNKKDLLEKTYTKCARELKQEHTIIFGPNYDKRVLKRDIMQAQEISPEAQEKSKKILGLNKLNLPNKLDINYPNLMNFTLLKQTVNQILSLTSNKKIELTELNNEEKENFAYEGLKIHEKDTRKICAFCGNKISQERWDALNEYFSNRAKEIQTRIKNGVNTLTNEQKKLDSVSKINSSLWYEPYKKNLALYMEQQENIKKEISHYIALLLQALEQKKNNLFTPMDAVEVDIPCDFSECEKSILALWKDNIEYNKNIKMLQLNAKTTLLNHFVARKYKELNIEKLEDEYRVARNLFSEIDYKIKNEDRNIQSLEENRAKLLLETQNEERAVQEINKLLQNLGNQGFTLFLKNSENDNGMYGIKDYSGKERDIETLSTGEKNIVGFLWFLLSLNDLRNSNNREQIIVLDDPINSNDANSQFLILAEIKNLMSKCSNNNQQIFLLTHNNYFFNQIRMKNDDKHAYFKFEKDVKTSILEIHSAYALGNAYAELWEELAFTYKNNRVNLMWNAMRRIIDVFGNFLTLELSPKSLVEKCKDGPDKTIYLALLEGMNVNSHSKYYGSMIDLSEFKRERLINDFRQVFKLINMEGHYKCYWKKAMEVEE